MKNKLFIGNEWVEAEKGKYFNSINPSNEEIISNVSSATREDVAKAVHIARECFDTQWKFTTGRERASYLMKIARIMHERRDDLAKLETLDNGKPLAESYIDIDTAIEIFKMYAEMAEDLDDKKGEELAIPGEHIKSKVSLYPIGVVAQITPWNFPVEQFTWKVAPAIAAGCTCIIKPSEVTSLTALALGEVIREAELPAGVVNIVTGTGLEAGQALVEHKDINKIYFTGSTATGKKIMSTAAQDLKRVSLELGGKSPIIVFDDVDIDIAVEWVLFGVFVNQGQVCTSTSRLLVHKNIANEFLARLKERAEMIKIGDGFSEDVKMGPIINESQYFKIIEYIKSGVQEGATLLTGGVEKPVGCDKGYFIKPTVFVDVSENMKIWNEEIFGPVLSVVEFSSEKEAIIKANNSEYGLAAAVLTKDTERAERVSEQLEAGIVWQNCNQMVVIQAPWGGVKKSGMGRELGRWGLESYLEPKQKTKWILEEGLGWYN